MNRDNAFEPRRSNPPAMPLPDRIRDRLSNLNLRRLGQDCTGEAAVLMPIFERDGEPYFLLTRRTEEVQTHKGQISFPGGMREGTETLERTALRETYEEVGIDAGSIQILGRFHDYLSVTDYRVSPFAGFLKEPFQLQPQEREVAEVLYVPFRIFRDPSLLRIERWTRGGRELNVHFYTYGQHEIWGLTARIIKEFLEELLSGW